MQRLRPTVLAAVVALATGAVAAPAGAASAPPRRAYAVMRPQNRSRVGGDARLAWNGRRHMLVVRLRLKHVKDRSRHPARIEAGPCAGTDQAVVVRLRDVVANEFGGGRATSRIRDIPDVQLDGGWHVAVYRGPGADGGADQRLACGDVGPVRR